MPVAAVNQHAGFTDIHCQVVDMRIVNPEEDGGLGVRLVHSRQKLLGVAVVLLQRAVTQANIVRGQTFAYALDHTVVKDVRPLVKGALWGEDNETVEQQTARSHSVQHSQLARACQHLRTCFFTGIRLPGKDPRNGAD